MTREVHFPIPDIDVEAIQHVEPARVLDACLAALRYKANDLNMKGSNEGDLAKVNKALTSLTQARNAWVLALGTIRLQCLGGDVVKTSQRPNLPA